MMVAIAAFGIEAAALRDRFEERRLAAPVLADEERYAAAKLDVDALRERFEIEREARCIPFLLVVDDLPKKWAGSGQYTRACLSLPRHFRCLFSLAHFPVNRVDESRLIELRDETRVDNVVDRNLRHLGIEFCEKGDQRGDAFFGRIRFSNVRGVAANIRKPYPTKEGVASLIAFLAKFNPKVAQVTVDDVVDASLVAELDKTGFIDAVYREMGQGK